MTEISKKEQVYELVRLNPFISQHDLALQLRLSRSAVAGHIASLMRERRLLGRAYVLPDKRPIMCLGGANLDRKLRTLSRLQMGTSNPAQLEESFGGVARNIAENLARLGAPVALLTVLGDDASGLALEEHANRAGIDTGASLRLAGTCSGTYMAVLDAGGEMLLALADMQLYDALTPQFLASRQRQRCSAALTVADLNLPRESVQVLLADAVRDRVALVLVAVSKPKMDRLPLELCGLRLLILNRGELETRAARALDTDAEVLAACRALQQQGAQDVIVTLGSEGVLYTTPDGIVHLPAPPVEVVDVTGAGDAFAAAVCWTLFQGDIELDRACRRGLRLAAMTLACAATVCPVLHPGSLDAASDSAPNLAQPAAQPAAQPYAPSILD